MLDVTGFGICSLNSIPQCYWVIPNLLCPAPYSIDRSSIYSQDLASERVVAVCLFWVLLLFSTLTKVAGRHF